MNKSDGEVTRLLVCWSQGDRSALSELTPLVYRELRRLAAAYLRRERRSHTLQPTALVHEGTSAWLITLRSTAVAVLSFSPLQPTSCDRFWSITRIVTAQPSGAAATT
jgi:hypothetical protein